MKHRIGDIMYEEISDRRHGGRRRGGAHGNSHGESHGGGHRGRHRGGRRGGRLFDYGELRLLVLSMIAGQPSHGYELMKSIEERFGGSYSPSPGVIYPTLSWLEDMGYAAIDAADGGRRLCRITAEGEAFLVANREAADALLARVPVAPAEMRPAPVVRAMENLKLALRLRFQRGPIDKAAAEDIAEAIDAAVRKVEQSP
ncbi:MAG: PadR family transcriptional regulator [Rhodospirillaceae bacterium]